MKKVLVIEDQKEDYDKICDLLGITYDILPNKFEEMSACIEYPRVIGKSIVDFSIQQIDENFRELGLVICDIKLGNDWKGGNKVIRAIRNHKISESPGWTSLVPIIAMTHFANKQESIIDSGADFSLLKEVDESLFLALVNTNMDSFERRLNYISSEKLNKEKEKANAKKVFIVHGRNNEVKLEVARIVEHLKMKPIILHEQPNQGRTIFEKFEENGSDVGFAIILLTADDLGRLKTKEETDNKLRARQNVVFEMGYFMGCLSRSHVFLLCDNDIEEPSDLDGIVYHRLSDNWQLELVRELKACGYDVDANDL